MKIRTQKTNYYEGYYLDFNGRKVNRFCFCSLSALREWWSKYRELITAGYIEQTNGTWYKPA